MNSFPRSIIVLLLFLLGGMIQPASAQQRQEVCSIEELPPGWMIVAFTQSVKCGITDGQPNTQWIIENMDDKPAGSLVEVCSLANLPEGWVVIGESPSLSPCGVYDGKVKARWIIKKT